MADPHSEFLAHVQRLQGNLEKYSRANLSEAQTRKLVIDPIIELLGYVDIDEVRYEVWDPASKQYLDYELYVGGVAHVIVEAKALRHIITDQAVSQCVHYATDRNVRWCIITNGVSWEVYDAQAKAPTSEKRLAGVRLDGDDAVTEEAWNVLSMFARGSLAQPSPLTKLVTECAVVEALSRADSSAIRALRDYIRSKFGEQVTAQAVVDAVMRLRLSSPRYVPKGSGHAQQPAAPGGSALTHADGDARLRAVITGTGDKRCFAKPDGTPVTLGDLVRAQLLPPDALLELRFAGVSHPGRVRDGGIEVNGTVYKSLSNAAGTIKAGQAANGWKDWCYQGRSLSQLREQLLTRLAEGSETA